MRMDGRRCAMDEEGNNRPSKSGRLGCKSFRWFCKSKSERLHCTRRTRIRRVVVELALLHPLEAEGVPAQRCVGHELRLELAVRERHLSRDNAKCDPAEIHTPRATTFHHTPGAVCTDGFWCTVGCTDTHLAAVTVDDASDERRLAHARVHPERAGWTAKHLPLPTRLVGRLAPGITLQRYCT